MNVEARFRSRVTQGSSIEVLNSKLLDSLSKIDGLWSPGRQPSEVYFEHSKNSGGATDLTDALVKDVRGAISYADRSYARIDKALADDVLTLQIDLEQVDYARLALSVFPALVEACAPYRAAIVTDLNMDMDDFEEIVSQTQNLRPGTELDIDGRDTVFRIQTKNFFDELLCKRAFGVAPAEVARKLKGKVASVEEMRGGVVITLADSPLQGEQLLEASKRAMIALK